jgi:dTMP kinase
MKGRFITFEGTEGSGKSTQIQLLATALGNQGLLARVLREPGGTPLCEEIRHLLKHSQAGREMTPETELLLMNASRAQLVRESIRPALDRGEIVLCDRFFHSTIAYQGYGRGLDLTSVRKVIDFAVGPTRPDLTLFLHVSLEESERRRAARQNGTAIFDRFENTAREFFQRVEKGFLETARDPAERMLVIDASPSVEIVEKAIWRAVQPLLAPG